MLALRPQLTTGHHDWILPEWVTHYLVQKMSQIFLYVQWLFKQYLTAQSLTLFPVQKMTVKFSYMYSIKWPFKQYLTIQSLSG